MPRKIIYLINPISGTQGKSSLQELISRRTRQESIEFSILPTNAEGNYDFLIPHIAREKVTDIVICGGDGTVNAVAAALQGSSVRVGIIPMGSGNGLAFAAKIPRAPSRALDVIFAGQASYIDAFTINGQFSCMLCGIGFDAKVAHEFARQPKRGLQTYIKVSLANFLSAGFYPFTIDLQTPGATSPHTAFQTEAFFISIANGNQFGNNITIAPRASLSDGLLDIVIVKKMHKLRMFIAVIRQVWGGNPLQTTPKDLSGKGVLYFQVPALTIGNSRQAPLHIDGEPKDTAARFDIRIAPKVFQLIQP